MPPVADHRDTVGNLEDLSDRVTGVETWKAVAAPMILSNISVPLVALVDSMVIGHLPHAHQLGAVAVGASLYTFLAWAMGFLRMGATGFAAQAAGRGDGAALRQILLQGLLLALGLAGTGHSQDIKAKLGTSLPDTHQLPSSAIASSMA